MRNTFTCASCSQDDFEHTYYVEASPGDRIVLPAGSATWGDPSRDNAGIIYDTKGVEVVGQGDDTVITLHDGGGTYANGVVAILSASNWHGFKVIGSDVSPVTMFAVSPYMSFDRGFKCHDITYSGRDGGAYFIFKNAYIHSLLAYDIRFLDAIGSAELIGGKGLPDSWQRPATFGSAEGTFIEDCRFYEDCAGYVSDFNANDKGRVAFNLIEGQSKADAHGFASNGNPARGVRHVEYLFNQWTKEGAGNWANIEHRGGGIIAIGNTSVTGLMILRDYAYDRESTNGPWPNYGVAASMAFGVSTTITTTAPHGWETGYKVWVKADGGVFPTGWHVITKTGASTFTIPVTTISNVALNYVAVWRTPLDYPLFDQTGNGEDGGDREPGIIIGNLQGGVAWAREIKPARPDADGPREYYRTLTGNPSADFDDADIIAPNRDFVASAGFDTLTGAFMGTYAEMMAMDAGDLEEGFAFWVLDRGDWNLRVAPGASGELRRWDGSAWQIHYTPYQYPHPNRPVARWVNKADGATPPIVVTENITIFAENNGATATWTCRVDGPVRHVVVTEHIELLSEDTAGDYEEEPQDDISVATSLGGSNPLISSGQSNSIGLRPGAFLG